MILRIVSINLRHGGGRRVAGLMNWLTSKSPSAAVLTEWRDNPSGARIRKWLSDEEYHTAAARADAKVNSVLLASRAAIGWRQTTPPDGATGDLILTDVEPSLCILGCYFPQGRAKAPFFEKCIEIARNTKDLPLVMIGDLNTGRNDLDVEETGAPFYCADLFEALTEQAGLVDLWRACNGDRREWTWHSRTNGFRIDHAFGNNAFIERFPDFRCFIDHEPRQKGLTDHSAIILEVE
jgi:exodeoxyribonuclease III